MSLAKLPNEIVEMIFDCLDTSTLYRVKSALSGRIGELALHTMRRKTLRYQQQHLRPYCPVKSLEVRHRYRFARYQAKIPIIRCVK